jgi:hypothetical protein
VALGLDIKYSIRIDFLSPGSKTGSITEGILSIPVGFYRASLFITVKIINFIQS